MKNKAKKREEKKKAKNFEGGQTFVGKRECLTKIKAGGKKGRGNGRLGENLSQTTGWGKIDQKPVIQVISMGVKFWGDKEEPGQKKREEKRSTRSLNLQLYRGE